MDVNFGAKVNIICEKPLSLSQKYMKTPAFLLFTAAITFLSMAGCTSNDSAVNAADTSVAADSMSLSDLVLRVRATSRLYTAEYQVHKIVTHRDVRRLRGQVLGHQFEAPLTLGDRKVAIPIDVTLRAYVDFTSFSQDNIERSADGQTIHIILPDPKVVVTASRVDHARTRQYSDLLRSAYTDEEMTAFTRQGVQAVVRSIPDMGIIETARQSAAATLIPIVASLGFDESRVVITFRQEQYTTRDLPRIMDVERKRHKSFNQHNANNE